MAAIHFKAMGFVDRFFKEKSGEVSIEEGSTIQQLIDQLGIPKKYASVVILNDAMADCQATLKNGDEVVISSIVGGA